MMEIAIWAYLDNNLGDDMMIKLMANRFPDITFTVYSESTTVKETFSSIKNIKLTSDLGKKRNLDNIDALIIIGGSIFQIDTIPKQIGRIFRLNRLRKIKNKGIMLATIGCNLGPYSNKYGIKLTELELRYSDLVTVRDKYSYKLLKNFKKIEEFHLADDIVYNYKNIPKEKKNIGLGISAYRSINSEENNYNNYQALARIADSYINKTGKKVALFAFDSEHENDLSAAHHIFNLSEKKDYIEIVPYLGNQDNFLSKFSTCESMVAIRFHSAILADVFKIPFLPIAYSNKMLNLINDRDFDSDIIKIGDLNMDLKFDDIVNRIISGDGLFKDFLENGGSSSLHFDKLEQLFNRKSY